MFEETNQAEISAEETTSAEEGLLPYSLFEQEEEKPQEITVKYNGEERKITLDEAKTYAQKGMNYDRIYAQRQDAHQVLDLLASQKGMSRDELIATSRGGEISNLRWEKLLSAYPDIDAAKLPKEVFLSIENGLTPIEAYQKHLIEKLSAELSSRESESRAVGSLQGNCDAEYDAFLEGFFGSKY